MASDSRSFEVLLDSSEVVARGGARRVTWLIENERRWVHASQYPGARSEPSPRGQGVIFRNEIRVRLAEGVRLQRVESEPERSAARDVLDHLWSSRQSPRSRQRRSYFRVGGDGRLERIDQR